MARPQCDTPLVLETEIMAEKTIKNWSKLQVSALDFWKKKMKKERLEN